MKIFRWKKITSNKTLEKYTLGIWIFKPGLSHYQANWTVSFHPKIKFKICKMRKSSLLTLVSSSFGWEICNLILVIFKEISENKNSEFTDQWSERREKMERIQKYQDSKTANLKNIFLLIKSVAWVANANRILTLYVSILNFFFLCRNI